MQIIFQRIGEQVQQLMLRTAHTHTHSTNPRVYNKLFYTNKHVVYKCESRYFSICVCVVVTRVKTAYVWCVCVFPHVRFHISFLHGMDATDDDVHAVQTGFVNFHQVCMVCAYIGKRHKRDKHTKTNEKKTQHLYGASSVSRGELNH